MSKYFIPFYYTIHSRSKGVHFLSYFLMVLFPPFIILLSNDPKVNLLFITLYLLAFTGMLSFYEVGYIWNDTVCIKKDPHPTKRIDDEETAYLSAHLWPVTIAKIIVSVVIVVILSRINVALNLVNYGISLMILIVFYVLHNSVRGRLNYLTVFILTTLNYSCPIILLSSHERILFNIIFVLILFSIPKSFFYIVRKERKKSDSKESFKFAAYYFLCAVAAIILRFTKNISFWLIILPAYLCFYRFGINFLSLRNKEAA